MSETPNTLRRQLAIGVGCTIDTMCVQSKILYNPTITYPAYGESYSGQRTVDHGANRTLHTQCFDCGIRLVLEVTSAVQKRGKSYEMHHIVSVNR